MMISNEKLEHYGNCYCTLKAILERIGPTEIPTFYQYLKFQIGESTMKTLCINRYPLPLLGRIRRAWRRWIGKGKQHV